MPEESETKVIAGFAVLPQSVPVENSLGYVAVEFEINPVDLKVVGICCTLPPSAEEIIHSACFGEKFEVGIEKAIVQLDKLFFGVTKPAIIDALKDADKWYKKWQGHAAH